MRSTNHPSLERSTSRSLLSVALGPLATDDNHTCDPRRILVATEGPRTSNSRLQSPLRHGRLEFLGLPCRPESRKHRRCAVTGEQASKTRQSSRAKAPRGRRRTRQRVGSRQQRANYGALSRTKTAPRHVPRSQRRRRRRAAIKTRRGGSSGEQTATPPTQGGRACDSRFAGGEGRRKERAVCSFCSGARQRRSEEAAFAAAWLRNGLLRAKERSG